MTVVPVVDDVGGWFVFPAELVDEEVDGDCCW